MPTDWSKLTVVELRGELKKRGLPCSGKKVDLVGRLDDYEQAAQSDEPPVAEADSVTLAESDAAAPEGVPDIEKEHEKTPEPEKIPEKTPEKTPKKTPETAAVSNSEESAQNNGQDETVTSAQNDVGSGPKVPTEKSSENVKSSAVQAPTEAKDTDEPTPSPPALVADVAKDGPGRKRRSHSPTPAADEVARKRARTSDEDDQMDEADASNLTEGKIPQGAAVEGSSAAKSSNVDQNDEMDGVETNGSHKESKPQDSRRYEDEAASYRRGHSPSQDNVDVESSLHLATRALYIKNFMRPLRENQLRDYLETVAVGLDTNDQNLIEDFYLDPIRTHAFVRFTSIAAAARVRRALHGRIWPVESTRRELWVDFMPPDKFEDWVEQERGADQGRPNLKRWEVVYERDDGGVLIATLVEAGAESTIQPPARASLPAQQAAAAPQIPTGPSRTYTGIEGAPKGPRGGSSAMHRDAAGEVTLATRARPSLLYKPMTPDMVERRLANMRSYYTKDETRDMGREDEINRYTFEDQGTFVDRGKEVFVGIRPPHRQRERERERGGGHGAGRSSRGQMGGGDRGDRGDRGARYGGGGGGGSWAPRRDDGPSGVQRSRFTGEPLPNFNHQRTDRRGGGGGGGGGVWRQPRSNFRSDRM